MLVLLFIATLFRLPDKINAMERQRKWEGEVYQFAALFTEIYSDVQERYVEEVDSEALFEGAIRGMFTALDPHSQWLPPDSFNQLTKETDGEFSGVGLHITLDKNGILTAITPIPGTPAAKAGIQPWDRIIEINGESTEGITLLEAVKKLTGADGSKVDVKVLREGENEALDFTMTRDKIKVQSVFSKVLEYEDSSVGYLRLSRFADTTAEDVKTALKEFNKQNVNGVIVDLRYNTGGLLDKAIEISDFFLEPKTLIVSTKGRNPENNKNFYALEKPLWDKPMIVLVNRGSASASEIFAGAIQDNNRGFVVGPEGEKTFGKGSVQTISTLRNSLQDKEAGEATGSGLRLTTALYYTPSGVSIHEKGIEPDFFVTKLDPEVEREFLRHGMLGDPDTHDPLEVEEAGEDTEKSASADEDTSTTTAEVDGVAVTDDLLAHDVQLRESMKYVEMTLKIENRLAKG